MSTDKQPARRLGRGLEALLPTRSVPADAALERSDLKRIPLGEIRPNPYQPRREFKSEELSELEASLRANGLLQPITVRPAPNGVGYELIAGERRLRAATRLGWSDIPALLRPIDDQMLLTLALVENLQRADLDPIEEAEGYQRLVSEFELTQQQVADAVGKDRSTVANMLRLLNLPTAVQRMLQEGQLSLGHARALLSLGQELRIVDVAKEAVAKGLTVRDLEARARPAGKAPTTKSPRKGAAPENAEVRSVREQLRERLQTDVHIRLTGEQRGHIEVAFYSAE